MPIAIVEKVDSDIVVSVEGYALLEPYIRAAAGEADAAAASAALAGQYANANSNTDIPGAGPGERGALYWLSVGKNAAVNPDDADMPSLPAGFRSSLFHAERSKGYRDDAETIAQAVADLGLPANIFVDVALATAEAGLANGTTFKLVTTSTGIAEVRRRTVGGSTLLYTEVTQSALASTAGNRGQNLIGRSTVAQLAADTTPARGIAAAWYADDGMYTEAAPAATEFDFQTNGGVKLMLRPTPIVDARALGFVGGTDETVKLERLRRFAIRNPGTTFDFREIAAPELRYTTPKWLAAVQDADVNLTNIGLNNLGAGTFGYSDMDVALHLGSGSPFHNYATVTGQINPAAPVSGDLLTADVEAGARTIPIGAATANYAVGNRVLLRWYERQGSATFPPNAGYWEWNEILSVNPGAGTVTLKWPTRYAYRIVSPTYNSGAYYNINSGPAMLLNLDRAGYKQAGRLKIIGGYCIDTGNAPNPGYDGAVTICGADHVEIENFTASALFTACARVSIMRNSTLYGEKSELDKMCDLVRFDTCKINGMTQGTGCEHVAFEGESVLTGDFQLRSRSITIGPKVRVATNAIGGSGVQIAADAYPRREVVVEGATFVVPTTGSPKAGIQPGNVNVFTPDAITASLITVNTTNPGWAALVQNIEAGQVINRQNGKPVENFYIIKKGFDGSGNLLIEGWCEAATPTAGVPRVLWFCQSIRAVNNTVLNQPPRWALIAKGRNCWHIDTGSGAHLVRLQSVMRHADAATASMQVNGYIQQITVNVIKPYTGSDATCVGDYSVQGGGDGTAFASINLKIAGRRVFAPSGAGAVAVSGSGDTIFAFPNNAWCENLLTFITTPAGQGVITDGATDPAKLPFIVIEVEAIKPRPFSPVI